MKIKKFLSKKYIIALFFFFYCAPIALAMSGEAADRSTLWTRLENRSNQTIRISKSSLFWNGFLTHPDSIYPNEQVTLTGYVFGSVRAKLSSDETSFCTIQFNIDGSINVDNVHKNEKLQCVIQDEKTITIDTIES